MSDLGTLSHCMVDSDSESLRRSRRRRRQALVAAGLVEGTFVLVMLIWPLITPAVLPRAIIVTALPPYAAPNNPAPAQMHPATHSHPSRSLLYDLSPTAHPVRAGSHADISADSAPAPGMFDSAVGVPGPGEPGISIPGASGSGPLPPPPSRPPRPARVSRGVMEASLIHRVEPVYPVIARNMNLSGEVRLRALIGTDGAIKRVDVISGSPILARAAVEAVLQWRYKPTLLSGEPVEVETYITVTFVID